jgi:hypothetical protein
MTIESRVWFRVGDLMFARAAPIGLERQQKEIFLASTVSEGDSG